MIIRSLGGATRAIEVILTATDATVLARLTSRESRWSAGASSATQFGDGPPTCTPQRPGYRESQPTGGRSSTWQRTSLRQPGRPQRQRSERRTLRRVSAPQADPPADRQASSDTSCGREFAYIWQAMAFLRHRMMSCLALRGSGSASAGRARQQDGFIGGRAEGWVTQPRTRREQPDRSSGPGRCG
jgi:hypothetical protein